MEWPYWDLKNINWVLFLKSECSVQLCYPKRGWFFKSGGDFESADNIARSEHLWGHLVESVGESDLLPSHVHTSRSQCLSLSRIESNSQQFLSARKFINPLAEGPWFSLCTQFLYHLRNDYLDIRDSESWLWHKTTKSTIFILACITLCANIYLFIGIQTIKDWSTCGCFLSTLRIEILYEIVFRMENIC